MSKREVNYPHTISFRLTNELWLRLEQEVAETNLTVHEWCRLAVLERLNRDHGLSKSERILLEQFACSQYLVANGFQLLADDKLTSEEWKSFARLRTKEPLRSRTWPSRYALKGTGKVVDEPAQLVVQYTPRRRVIGESERPKRRTCSGKYPGTL